MISTKNYINEKIFFPFISEKYKIDDCRFKKYDFRALKNYNSRKEHFHNFYEIHFIQNGYMKYNINDKEIVVSSGQYLLIFPKTTHVRLQTEKNTVSFHLIYDLKGEIYCQNVSEGFKTDVISDEMFDILHSVNDFYSVNAHIFNIDIGILLFRVINKLSILNRTDIYTSEKSDCIDTRFLQAKQLIDENIKNSPKCADVAKSCFLSTKQLSRIFFKYESISLKGYIDRRRFEEIYKMISDTDISLKQISETFGFCDENYFNKFFKKHSGMCPGEYRASIK